MKHYLAQIFAVGMFMAALGFTVDSHATCVNGKVEFWWELGNYCDSGDRDCSNWRYTSASQDTWVPLKEVIFELRDGSSNNLLATGDVDNSGNFSTCYSGSASSLLVRFFPEHKSGAFQVQTSSGGRWVFNCSTSTGSGDLGTCRYGSNGSPNAVASVYYTGYAFLKNVANQMDRVEGGFTNVSVRMDSDATETRGYDKVVKLGGSSSHEFGFHSTNHEMGHVASHMASRSQYLGPDNSNKSAGIVYDACGGNTSHTFFSTDECKDAVDHEGLADFFGSMARLRGTSENPCESLASRAEECLDDGDSFDLESNVCPSSGRDQESQVVRYLWDTFDPSRSTPQDEYDEILNRYPNGRNNHDKSENWCCTFWVCDPCDHDEKNTADFNHHFEAQTGEDGVSLLNAHCL